MRHLATLISVLVFGFFSLLVGCSGGGGGGPDHNKKTIVDGDSEISVGELATCSVKGLDFKEECTVFFGTTPFQAGPVAVDQDYFLDEEDQTVQLKVPPTPPGDKKIEFCCGLCDEEHRKEICGVTVVVAKPKTIIACSDDSDCPAGKTCKDEEGCVSSAVPPVAPPAGGGGVPVVPSGPSGEATDTDGDGVPNTSDSCANTPSGTIVDATGCPPPPDADGDGVPDADDDCDNTPAGGAINENGCTPPPPPATSSFPAVVLVQTPQARLSTWKIQWSTTNAKAAYLWGDIFNRTIADAALPAANRCKLVGAAPPDARYLVTLADGNNINPNLDENAATNNPKKQNKPYLEGVLCNNSNGPTDDDCKKKVATDNSGTEGNPDCRIDLIRDNGQVIAAGEIYTRSWIYQGTVCLVVQGQDNVWKAECQQVEAPKPTITPVGSGITLIPNNAPKMKVKFNYTKASSAPQVKWKACEDSDCETLPALHNCVKDSGLSTGPNSNGSGNFEGTCDLAPVANLYTRINIDVKGIGVDNKASQAYRIAFDPPTLTFDFADGKPIDCEPGTGGAEDCKGDVTFRWKVVRDYHIRDINTGVLTDHSTNLVKKVELFNGSESKETYANPNNSAWTFFKMMRDHGHTQWSATVQDYVGNPSNPIVKNWAYSNVKFNIVVTGGGSYSCKVDDCDAWGEEDCCDGDCGSCPSGNVRKCNSPTLNLQGKWSGQHIKHVESTCGGPFNVQPSNNSYIEQFGTWSKSFSSWTSGPCQVKAQKYNGDWIIREVGGWTLNNNC